MGLMAPVAFTRTSNDPVPAVDARVLAAIRESAWLVFNLSGGKDSTASAHAAIGLLDALGHPRERRIAIHADLGRAEWRSAARSRTPIG